jgi:hypothetical protein
MYVFRGKFTWGSFAVNDALTIIFPGAFGHGEPVYAYWQWTKITTGATRVNVCAEGTINSVTTVKDEYMFGFFYERIHKFDAVLAADAKQITVTMSNRSNQRSSPTTLQLSYSEPSILPLAAKCLVYTGKLNWLNYAADDMITVVVPNSLDWGEPICAYWQWTVNAKGAEKSNYDAVGFVDSSTKAGKITFHANKYYSFEGEVANAGDKLTLTMRNPKGEISKPVHLVLSTSKFARKQVGNRL